MVGLGGATAATAGAIPAAFSSYIHGVCVEVTLDEMSRQLHRRGHSLKLQPYVSLALSLPLRFGGGWLRAVSLKKLRGGTICKKKYPYVFNLLPFLFTPLWISHLCFHPPLESSMDPDCGIVHFSLCISLLPLSLDFL